MNVENQAQDQKRREFKRSRGRQQDHCATTNYPQAIHDFGRYGISLTKVWRSWLQNAETAYKAYGTVPLKSWSYMAHHMGSVAGC